MAFVNKIRKGSAEYDIQDAKAVSTGAQSLTEDAQAQVLTNLGITATKAELNKLDGVTVGADDINKLSGLTATSTELNKLAGNGVTAADFTKLHSVSASAEELNKLDGVTVGATEINYLSGTTSAIQKQINDKIAKPGSATEGQLLTYKGNSWTAQNAPVSATLSGNKLTVGDQSIDIQKPTDEIEGTRLTGSTSINTSGRAATAGTADTANAVKSDINLPGKATTETAALNTNDTQIATTAFVDAAIKNVLSASKAMTFEGVVTDNSQLPAKHDVGATYVVNKAGTYAGKACEIGDMIVCVTSGSVSKDEDWTVIQANINGAVTGPASSVEAHVAAFDGVSGKAIKDSGFTIAKNVPSDAKFTDTTYSAVTPGGDDGLMSGADKTKLDGVEVNANNYTHPNSGVVAGTYRSVTVDAKGHVTTGTNPTTLSGYGITDAKIEGQTITLGGSSITVPDGSSGGTTILVQPSQPSGQKTGDFWYKVIS